VWAVISLFNFSYHFAISSVIYCVITILYKPATKSVRKDKCRPAQLRNRLIDFDEIRTLELSSEDHPFRSDGVGGLGEYPVCYCRWKDNFRGSCFPGSAETLVRRGGITNHYSIAYSLSNISVKNYRNRLMCVEVIVCNSSVIFWDNVLLFLSLIRPLGYLLMARRYTTYRRWVWAGGYPTSLLCT